MKFRGNAGGNNSTLNRSRVTKSVNAGSRIPSATTSAASSPATPRASWNLSSTGGESDSNNSGAGIGRSTSICSGKLEKEKKNKILHSKQDSFGSVALANNGRIPRPTNLAGERSPRDDKVVAMMTKKVHQTLNVDEKSPRNSFLPGYVVS